MGTRSRTSTISNNVPENVPEKSCDGTELDVLQELLRPIKESLDGIQKLYEAKFAKQSKSITLLETKVQALEEQMIFRDHMSNLQSRKIDDLEQNSRKVNLRIKGIEVDNDSPKKIMDYIIQECNKNELPIDINHFDRCHRVGPVYYKSNKAQQDVLLKLGSWSTRHLLYQNRKKFKFLIFPDLTVKRKGILDFVKDEMEHGDAAIKRVVDFVFCDLNCKLKFKSKSDKFFKFNSIIEFFNLVNRLDQDECLADEWKADEQRSLDGPTINDLYF